MIIRERLIITKIGSKNLFSALIILTLLDLHCSIYQYKPVKALAFYGDEEMDLSEYWDPKDSDGYDN
jgi:hypothetical protein